MGTIDLTAIQTEISSLIVLWGEPTTVQSLTLSYSTVPPAETWATSSSDTCYFQPAGGFLNRLDPGLAAETTHVVFADHDSGIIQNQRLIRSGDTNYYLVLKVEDHDSHLELFCRYVKGAV
jgi:hypothetical protein